MELCFMLILGIDPGYATLGYGVLRVEGQKFKAEDYGAITTKADEKFPTRLEIIYKELEKIFLKYTIEAVAVEKLYFSKNQSTAIAVAQARGIVLLAAQKARVKVYEYTPLQVKMSITGYGKATKSQIIAMVTRLLKLKVAPKPDDVADALGLGICHIACM
jgi:crossover junction endodeoxyribonuclease RuvC